MKEKQQKEETLTNKIKAIATVRDMEIYKRGKKKQERHKRKYKYGEVEDLLYGSSRYLSR